MRDGGFPVAQLVKNLPAMQETSDWFLGWEDSPGERVGYLHQYSWFSLVVQTVKNPPAMQETWVRSLGWEDPLEEGMGTHSSILVWRIPWTEEPGRLQSMELQRVRRDWATKYTHTYIHTHTHTHTHTHIHTHTHTHTHTRETGEQRGEKRRGMGEREEGEWSTYYMLKSSPQSPILWTRVL